MAPTSPVPAIWGEDHLLPRMPDGRGHMRERWAPGGIIYRVSPDGKQFEAVASGFRNIFDAAFNRDGELFTYDADMEYDFNTSWYRPTRINHVVSGAEFGWRNGAGKRPEFYPDNLPATLNIGPGSPTGVTLGLRREVPGQVSKRAVRARLELGQALRRAFASPTARATPATKEEFVTGAPLPITDAIIHPHDGAMYFTIGGRRVQSGVYRVTYTGRRIDLARVRTCRTTSELRSCATSWKRFTASKTPRPSTPLGRTCGQPIASFAGRPARPSSISRSATWVEQGARAKQTRRFRSKR